MPRDSRQYEEMRLATREKIRSAAMRLFARKGLAATSVQDIAQLAGISTGLMYRHYRSKEELFNELSSMAVLGLDELTRRFDSDGDPSELMQFFLQELYNDLSESEFFAELMVLMMQSVLYCGEAPQSDSLMSADRRLLATAAKVIRRGQEMGEFGDGDPEQMAMYMLSSIQGLGVLKIAYGDDFVMPAPDVLSAFLKIRK
jgi:AcrR family transcriptional regulator